MADEYPSMPATQAEWECHVAFCRLTIRQRNAAWREVEQLKAQVQSLSGKLAQVPSERC